MENTKFMEKLKIMENYGKLWKNTKIYEKSSKNEKL
jgi:hypothetical protein